MKRYRMYWEKLKKNKKKGAVAASTPESILSRLNQLKNQEFIMRVPIRDQDDE